MEQKNFDVDYLRTRRIRKEKLKKRNIKTWKHCFKASCDEHIINNPEFPSKFLLTCLLF